jgi:hypothetical protein
MYCTAVFTADRKRQEIYFFKDVNSNSFQNVHTRTISFSSSIVP